MTTQRPRRFGVGGEPHSGIEVASAHPSDAPVPAESPSGSECEEHQALNFNQHRLRGQIEQTRNNLLDLDLVVDDLRLAVDRSVEEPRVAVRERDRAAAHLASLVEWYAFLDGVVGTFGGEIADAVAVRTEALVP